MITIIRYRNDTYFGVEGKVEYPSTMHSGYIDEERKLMKWQGEKVKKFEETRENATFLNKVHVKKALENEISGWENKFKRELKDIEYKLNNVHGFSGFDQLWKKEYTFYHLNNTSIEDLIKPTN
jgi:hypothetical protein